MIGDLILAAWLGSGLGVYLWLLLYWLTTPGARTRYPGVPIVALMIVPFWPLIFCLVYFDPDSEEDK